MGKYEDQICQAVDVITNQKINKAVFDRTLEATIVSCENPETGKYRVQYQDATFIAFAKKTDIIYEKGTSVYVLIPSNNTEKDKIIIWAGEKNNVNVIKNNEQNSSGFFGSGVGRFTNPEKNSELFNDYFKSKVDKTAEYCHVGGYKNTISGTDGACFASFVYGSECNCSGKFDISFLTGLEHTISNNVFCSAIFGQNNSFLSSTKEGENVFKGHVGYSIISGLRNYIYSSLGDFVHGLYNICNTGANDTTHSMNGCNFLLGYFNYAETTENTEFLGMANAASGGLLNSFISGMQNKVINGNGNIINGLRNITEKSIYSIMTGMENTIHTESSLVVGGRNCGNDRLGLSYGDSVSEDEYRDIAILFSFGLWNCKKHPEDKDNQTVPEYGYKYTGASEIEIPAGEIFKEGKHLYPEKEGEILVWDRNVISSEDYKKIKNNYFDEVKDTFKASYFKKTIKDEDSKEYIYTFEEAPFPIDLQYLGVKTPDPSSLLKDSSFWIDRNLDSSHSIKFSVISGYDNHFMGNCEISNSGIFGQKDHFYGKVDACIIGGFSNHIDGKNDHSLIVGQQNIIKNITKSIVFGFDNQINGNFGYPILIGGQKNKIDDSKCYLMVLGNGGKLPGDAEGTMRYGERSNAFAVDIDGNVYCRSINTILPSGGNASGIDLSNYYNKQESDKRFSNISSAESFPTEEVSLGDIFFLRKEEKENGISYIYNSNGWERLNSGDIDKITYKGILSSSLDLPLEGNIKGDLYLIEIYKKNSEEEDPVFSYYLQYIYTGEAWQQISYPPLNGDEIRLKGFLTSEEDLNKVYNPQIGDSYLLNQEEQNYANQYLYTELGWIKINGSVDINLKNDYVTIEDFNNTINEIKSQIPETNEALYLTKIDFSETSFTLTNNKNEEQTCTIEETIVDNKNIITITNLTNEKTLVISYPVT